jgi:hypothetical protein
MERIADIEAPIPEFPPADETGDVDLSLLECSLRLTPAERAERHYAARVFAERLRKLSREHYGSIIDDLEASTR